MPQTPELELDILSMAYGASAIARSDDGRVVFVERAAPGDRVRASVIKEHPRRIEARTLEVLSPGPARIDPPCPHYAQCGGCPWQHISYPEQLKAKTKSLRDALERIGKISEPNIAPIVPSSEQFGYRNRIKLRFENGRLGFYSAHSNRIAPIDDCMIAEDPLRQALPIVEAFVAALSTQVTRVEIASRGLKPGLVVAINAAGRLRRSDTLASRAFVDDNENPVRGIHMWGRGWARSWGVCDRLYEIADGRSVLLPSASFGQVNTTANRLLVAAVEKAAVPVAGPRIVELYAGSGNFTMALAHRAGKISAVDDDDAAVEAGRAMVGAQGITNVGFTHARAELFLAEYGGRRPDVVVADPPRSGLREVAAAIADLSPKRIVYVSCNPATLARDAALLTERGYSLGLVQPFDLFPHTYHLETVSTFELT